MVQRRLPIPGSDDNSWGDILNDFLSVAHTGVGGLAANTVGAAQITDGSIPATKLDSATQAALANNLRASNNLSDLTSVPTARTNLGLGTAATHPASDFDTAGAAAAAVAGLSSTAVPSAVIETLPLLAYGNSYLGNNTNAVAYYFDRLKARIQPQFWANCGNNGMLAADACSFAYGTFTTVRQNGAAYAAISGTGAGTFIPSALLSGVTIIDVGRNDAGLDGTTTSGGTTAKSRAGFTNALDALIRLIRAGSKVENTAATFGGTWTTGASTSCSAGSVSFTTINGATATLSVTVSGAAAPVSLILLGIDNSANAVNGASYSITVDAGSPIAGTTSDQMRKTGHTPPNNAFGQLAVPLGTLAVGTHSIVLTHTGAAGQQLWLDCALIETPTPPTALVVKIAQIPTAGYSAGYPGLGASWTIDQTYNALMDTVITRFPSDQSVISWDPNASGWDSATLIGNTDGLHVHLNDAGNHFYANGLMTVLNGLSARAGLIRT